MEKHQKNTTARQQQQEEEQLLQQRRQQEQQLQEEQQQAQQRWIQEQHLLEQQLQEQLQQEQQYMVLDHLQKGSSSSSPAGDMSPVGLSVNGNNTNDAHNQQQPRYGSFCLENTEGADGVPLVGADTGGGPKVPEQCTNTNTHTLSYPISPKFTLILRSTQRILLSPCPWPGLTGHDASGLRHPSL